MTTFTSRYGNPADDYKGAHIWARCRHNATVVAVGGRIDARNVDHVIERSVRVVRPEAPFVLDLSGATSFSPAAVRLLTAVDEHCTVLGVQWALVAGDAVARRIRHADFPMLSTVAEAEHAFDDEILRRRRMLLPLLRRTA